MAYTVSIANGCSGATRGLPGVALSSLVLHRFEESSDASSHIFAIVFVRKREKDALRRDSGGLVDGPEGATTSATMSCRVGRLR